MANVEDYVKVGFENKPSTKSPLNSSNLNDVDNGVFYNRETLKTLNTEIEEIQSKVNGIIESGENQNGSYIKYSDGTLEQWGSEEFSSDGTSASSYKTFDFPIAFANNKYTVNSNITYTSNASYFATHTILTSSRRYGEGSVLNSETIYRRPSYSNEQSVYNQLYLIKQVFNWYAIGKWK